MSGAGFFRALLCAGPYALSGHVVARRIRSYLGFSPTASMPSFSVAPDLCTAFDCDVPAAHCGGRSCDRLRRRHRLAVGPLWRGGVFRDHPGRLRGLFRLERDHGFGSFVASTFSDHALMVEHDLFEKPASTFLDHALMETGI